MKRNKLYIVLILASIVISITGCQQEDYVLGELIEPSNLEVSYEIVGASGENPFGDGSGMIVFNASAQNVITYTYEFGDGKDNEIAPSGSVSHVFAKSGINTFDIVVKAVGTGGLTSENILQVEVLSSFVDDEALQFLTGGSSKKWYWAADQTAHIGLGPNDQVYADNTHTYAAWWSAAPFEKSSTSLYECEFIFTKTDAGLTFEQLNPTGEAFFQGLYATELGLGAEGSHPYDITGVKTVFFGKSESIATIDGGYRGTSMSISDGGFMGWYVGSGQYEIIQVTNNILKVRVEQPNNPQFAWYHIFTTVKPVE